MEQTELGGARVCVADSSCYFCFDFHSTFSVLASDASRTARLRRDVQPTDGAVLSGAETFLLRAFGKILNAGQSSGIQIPAKTDFRMDAYYSK
jgi:hypothetical protein